MKWTLFARLDPTVARARRLDPVADRSALAATLEANNPGLAADHDAAAALAMAGAALELLCRLPRDIDEAAASIVDPNPLAPADALARVAALAYVALRDDLLPDDQPGGGGLIDDAISLRATGVGAPRGWDQDLRARELEQLGVEARFLSLFLPRDRLPEFDRALDDLFSTVASYARAPLAELKDLTRRLIEHPPRTLAELLRDDHQIRSAARPKLFELHDAQLDARDDRLRFEFGDAVVIDLVGPRLQLVAR